ncbi:universal stress protein [Fibrivirga algicola]|uniref:Universal stress protein n=1 Tax=Fibrivirga algicola TaxID=2950420 RepID=A0ABX0QEE4_9BACT|nr:universal stress protein [Fibrivirga algicola]NID10794.1 universal stress protein [Fibrivirga algicola]
MMKLLVTTDFSDNSKAAIRFAIQVASQCAASLTFLHVLHVVRPTAWHESTYLTYERQEIAKARASLNDFVSRLYNELAASPADYSCKVKVSPVADYVIMGYAAEQSVDFICISTRGAGLLEKIMGTTTANLINQSTVPVIAVPGNYQPTRLTSIAYASDLRCLKQEVARVADFARLLGASISLLHVTSPGEPVIEADIIDLAAERSAHLPVDLHLQPADLNQTMIGNIDAAVQQLKPSIVVLFTKQDQGFFHQLFFSGNAVDYSFSTTTPLLVFAKSQ